MHLTDFELSDRFYKQFNQCSKAQPKELDLSDEINYNK